jgi:hypothetical protein
MDWHEILPPVGGRISCHEDNKVTEEQMAYALKQAELGISVEEVCRKMGISSATL